jgi:hypothetical protein
MFNFINSSKYFTLLLSITSEVINPRPSDVLCVARIPLLQYLCHSAWKKNSYLISENTFFVNGFRIWQYLSMWATVQLSEKM